MRVARADSSCRIMRLDGPALKWSTASPAATMQRKKKSSARKAACNDIGQERLFAAMPQIAGIYSPLPNRLHPGAHLDDLPRFKAYNVGREIYGFREFEFN